MSTQLNQSRSLAAEITRESSKQTYYSILLFVDRERIEDAFRAYGYFRWVDDVLDAIEGSQSEKAEFVRRQRNLLERCYCGDLLPKLCAEEQMLEDLVRNDTGSHAGLRSYLHHMMAVMEFDVDRRGRVITQSELDTYSQTLSVAVTDALFYFIGQEEPDLPFISRYRAVEAAHITHMLRDTFEDAQAGYFNVPSEYLQRKVLKPEDIESQAYREWVCRRIRLAHDYFKAGLEYIAQVKNFRCRLAGFAYAARFRWVLKAIERDRYCLRSEYSQRKSIRAALKMGWMTIVSLLSTPLLVRFDRLSEKPVRIEES